MYVQSFWNQLLRFLNVSPSKARLKSMPTLSEQNRLMHRLNSIKLGDAEAKSLNAYLTTVLEARCLPSTADLTATDRSECIVLEMSEEELRTFGQVLGAHSLRTFRAIVHSDDNPAQTRKLTVIGEHGLRLFQVHIQSRNHSSLTQITTS